MKKGGGETKSEFILELDSTERRGRVDGFGSVKRNLIREHEVRGGSWQGLGSVIRWRDVTVPS